jgi:DNA-binding PadR family transcriptional regulator
MFSLKRRRRIKILNLLAIAEEEWGDVALRSYQICKAANISPFSITWTLVDMEREGLISSRPILFGDQRSRAMYSSYAYHITSAGKEYLAR